MNIGPLCSRPDALRHDTAITADDTIRTPGMRIRRRGLRGEVRERLQRARALESIPPETFGFSLSAATWLFTITSVMYRWYFRSQCFGIENIPKGAFMLVANHGSHFLSWDGANIISASLLDADPPRLVHGMGHHRLMELPLLGKVAARIGAVDGRRPACLSLLSGGAAVLVFPEGVRALERRFSRRYQLVPFGHGFAHVAMDSHVPIVPVAAIGAEEEAPLLANLQWLKRLLRTPVAPITPTMLMPLPVRYRLHFGTPIHLDGPSTPERAAHAAEHVRDALQALVNKGLDARPHIFF
jgi:1-acyl-sn-glycerol-3-phosphate acyltransferase